MSEHDPILEKLAGVLQRLAHVTQEKKFGWRYAIGMRGNPALADINSSIREQLPQVIVRATVSKPEFEDLSLQSLERRAARSRQAR